MDPFRRPGEEKQKQTVLHAISYFEVYTKYHTRYLVYYTLRHNVSIPENMQNPEKKHEEAAGHSLRTQ